MGVVQKQDEALTVEQLLAIFEIAELDWWKKSKAEDERKETESMVTFVIIGFYISLRGKDVPLVVVDGILAFWQEANEHQTPRIMITLKGKFKGEGKNEMVLHSHNRSD